MMESTLVQPGPEASIDIASSGHRKIVSWLEQNPAGKQKTAAASVFQILIAGDVQPKGLTSKARVKLCGFVELCAKSSSASLRNWAFSKEQYQKLFNLYLEWNEGDSERSLRLVLDLLLDLIKRNPDKDVVEDIKKPVLNSLVRIVAGQSTKPLAKSATRVLDRFLGKSAFSLEEVGSAYKTAKSSSLAVSDLRLWRAYFMELFDWMKRQFVCPVAGRLVVTVYKLLRQESETGFLAGSQARFTVHVWHEWLLDVLTEEPLLLDSIKAYVFLAIFQSERKDSREFLMKMNCLGEAITSPQLELGVQATLQLAALEVGKRAGLVEEPAYDQAERGSRESDPVALHENLLSHVLIHPSPEIRAHALSLIISSSSTTRPYSPAALVLLRRHLGSYFADSDAKFRHEILGKVRDMYIRIRGGITVLKRSILRTKSKADDKVECNGTGEKPRAARHTTIISQPEAELTRTLELQVAFLRWYIGFLRRELVPTASYQRHVTSLKAALRIIQLEADPAKRWEAKEGGSLVFDQFDTTWTRTLLNLLMDPFDDVRDASSAVLKLLFADGRFDKLVPSDTTPWITLSEFLSRADKMASLTGRAYHANGVARAYELLHRFAGSESAQFMLMSELIAELEKKISAAEKNLGLAVLESPTHGLFSSLSYIVLSSNDSRYVPDAMDKLDELYRRMVSCCKRIWDVVKHVLCDDSPEGHIPDELDDMEGLDTKSLLSYSFRGIDESSKLMRAMALGLKKSGGEERACMPKDVFEDIGNLAFVQLSTLRHRGALTTVSQTFATCCQLSRCFDKGDNSMPLLGTWYQGGIKCIFTQASTTRRSAGIPSIITGILSANSYVSYEEVMDRLMGIASTPAKMHETDGSKLPQVHASNCITVIFKTGSLPHLEKKVEAYLPLCLQLAADNLRSDVWAIRNCGLLLLRGLMDNLFGTNESKVLMEAGWDGKANRIHYSRYPTLAPVLLGLLQSGCRIILEMTTAATAEAVFPALDIIRRAGPPPALRNQLQQYIAEYLGSPVWHVREMAARTLCSCLLHHGWLDALDSIMANAMAGDPTRQKNRFHGALLTAKFLIERLADVMSDQLTRDYLNVIATLKALRSTLFESPTGCSDIYAAYMEVVNVTAEFGLQRARSGDEVAAKLLRSLLLTSKEMQTISSEGLHGALLRKQLAVHRVYSLVDPDNTSTFPGEVGAMIGSRESALFATLEALARIWEPSHVSESLAPVLLDVYLGVCLTETGTEIRAIALGNLTDLLTSDVGKTLGQGRQAAFKQLWSSLRSGTLNPRLSNEIIRASGALVAHLAATGSSSHVRNLATMISEASTDDQPFDTRFAAAESLKFALTSDVLPLTPAIHPLFQALYTTLNSDDEEVRLLASSSLARQSGPVVPIEAAEKLLQGLHGAAGGEEISAAAACRMVGHQFPVGDAVAALAKWVSAEEQLREAMKLDDSLFVVEEQNLFIDEVREARRWAGVLEALGDVDEKAVHALRGWTAAGLSRMQELAAQSDDGPLGWTSSPAVFAICTRVVLSAVALARRGCVPDLKGQLTELREAGKKSRLSGLLLEMTQLEPPGE